METKEPPKHTPITKNIGVTPSEKYLGGLCEKTFLSLWSYPGVFHDTKESKKGGHGKEICDLLVVFGRDILIFSDKNCEFKRSDNILLDWNRWFKRAISKSASQVWGAERWIRQNPLRVYIDRECKSPIPIDLPDMESAKFHLIIVTHGVSEIIKELHGGSGSLMIDSGISGLDNHNDPFIIGDLDINKTFVHILDDDSLDTLMGSRDTISDFVSYLKKREALLRSEITITAPGEEELLAIYLSNMNEDNEHDFKFSSSDNDTIILAEGFWDSFQKDKGRIAQLKADEISYVWDDLIEVFNQYAFEGSQYYVTKGGIKDAERILRFMAGEPRVIRRVLSSILMKIFKTTPDDQRRLTILDPMREGAPHYVLLLFPVPKDDNISYERYRDVRLEFLRVCCLGAKMKYDHSTDIVGISTESGINSIGRSEDAIYFDARKWNE